jgi:hypothetical protein
MLRAELALLYNTYLIRLEYLIFAELFHEQKYLV